MNTGGRGHHKPATAGYTIVEVMIFLAVTSLLFVMVVVSFQGQQGKTQFTTSARDMESRVQDIINDVSTGFPGSNGSFTCSLGGGNKPRIDTATPDPDSIGTNSACIYIGKVLQLPIDGDLEGYNVYPIVGLRQVPGSSRLSTSFADAQPIAIAPPSSPDVDLTEEERLPVGIQIVRITSATSLGTQEVDGIGFFSTLGTYAGASDTIRPGALSVYMLPIAGNGAAGPISKDDMVQHIDDSLNFTDNELIKFFVEAVKPTITICMDSDSSNQHAELEIGGDGRQLTTDLEIFGGKC
jgi:hypothetical protein